MIFNKNIALPDGRTMGFHRVAESLVDMANNVLHVFIRSWETQAEAEAQAASFINFTVAIAFDVWDASMGENLEEKVIGLEWENYKNIFLAEPIPDFDTLKLKKSQDISFACYNAIVNGFECNTLGEAYIYPADDRDQANLSSTILRSMLPFENIAATYLFKCKNTAGEWDFRPHLAMQIQEVGRAAYTAILAAREKNAYLQVQVAMATTQEGLDAIQW